MSRTNRSGRIVKSSVQRVLLFRFALHWALFVFAFFSLLCVMHYFFGEPGQPLTSHLADMWSRYGILVLVLFSLLPYFFYDLIKLTHRIAGPMVRFNAVLHRAARGEHVEPIHFRDGDFWQELAEDFNVLLERLPVDESQNRGVSEQFNETKPEPETESEPASEPVAI